jgi:hypothetical protein
MNFSYSISSPVVLSTTSFVNHSAILYGDISGHHVIGASVPLPAIIKMARLIGFKHLLCQVGIRQVAD